MSPREITLSRGHLRLSAANFTRPLSHRGAYTILPDEDMEFGGLSDCNYCWHAGGGPDGGGSTGGGTRESPRRSPSGGFDCHETNLKCLMNKFCHETRHDS